MPAVSIRHRARPDFSKNIFIPMDVMKEKKTALRAVFSSDIPAGSSLKSYQKEYRVSEMIMFLLSPSRFAMTNPRDVLTPLVNLYIR